MQPVPPIIVGFDGSNSASDALRWALRLGLLTETPIRALTAWHVSASLAGDEMMTSNDIADIYESARQEAKLVSRRATEVAAQFAAKTGFSADIQHGNPGAVLVSESRQASMLVVGPRGHSPRHQVLFGSNARHCVTHAVCPTVIVPPGTETTQWHLRPIVVGFDGSEHSKLALRWAVDLATHTGAAMRILAVYDRPHGSVSARLIDGSVVSTEWSRRRDAEMALDEARTILDDMGCGSPAVFEILEGKPAIVLGEAGHQGSLLVVGSRGLGAFKRFVMGSVSTALVGSLECPTLVVPSGATRILDRANKRPTTPSTDSGSPLWSMGARAKQLHESELFAADRAT